MEDWSNVKKVYRKGVEVSAVYERGEKVWPLGPVEIKDYFYIENISNEVCDVTLTKTGSAPEINLEKSTNGVSWETIDTTQSTITSIPSNTKMYFRGINNGFASDLFDYNSITGSQQYNIGGNIMSLLYGSDFEDEKTLTIHSCFVGIFEGGTTLIDASDLRLPATTLTDYCYSRMFYNCTSLTTAPELPATTLKIYCYYRMFYKCTSLTTTPELPATRLASDCYSDMFYGCSSLTQAPELPATTLANYCYYYMFNGCTSLTKAPELPATTLVYQCYYYMFSGCTKLNYVKHNVTNWNTFHTTNWLNGVAPTGTMVCPADSTIPTNNSGIPTGWTKQSIGEKTWVVKDWGGDILPGPGKYIWNDGTYTYYSYENTQLQLVNGSWVTKDWGTRVPTYGNEIWKDNSGNIYYSGGGTSTPKHYVLSSNGFINKTWNYTEFTGIDIWKDKSGNIYYSGYKGGYTPERQYQLVNGSWVTKDWGDKSWGDVFPDYGRYIWSDNNGETYYSYRVSQYSNLQYKLVNGSWTTVDFGTIYPLYGTHVCNYNSNTYYFYDNGNKNVDKYQFVNGSWIVKDFGTELYPMNGDNVWTDNSGNTYYSDNKYQYQLINK